ncbi:formylglycine-generating enzyme family protein [Methanococcoides sp. AM1]|uniref:formylglycine-generating enzyme family protein n=1 Tax=Methanococcoides sp. AM1 TaxID=1201011 RepID=UPI001FCEC348|nr:formylglycine-generating enzyme family protein [Methanococcoides sp. AM1]
MKNELGMEVPPSVCEKAKEKGCHQGVKYVYMDGDYGGKLPASTIGGKKATRFWNINSANANKVNLGSGWVAFTSPSDGGVNILGDENGKQNIDPDLYFYSSSSSSSDKNEPNILESLSSKATDFERKLHEATKMWKEKEEEKRNHLEEEKLLKKWDEAERKQLEEEKFRKEKEEAARKQLEEEKFRKEKEKVARKQREEEELRKEQEGAKKKRQKPVKARKSRKGALIKWVGIIIAAWLFVSLVAIPFTDNSEGISPQDLGILNTAQTVIATENVNDNAVKNEEVIRAQELPKNYTNSIGMKFVLIPKGEFMMGSPNDEEGRYYDREGPIHEVTIEKDYYLGKYVVTQEQWAMVMGSNPSYSTGDHRPVESISWDEVQEFIKKLNSMEGTDKYRLPSEAEWEYACRAGTTTRYYFGDNESNLHEYAWHTGDIYSVGHLKPNSWGLYDMHGNVYEFVQDEWHPDYEGAPEVGSAWEEGISDFRTLRSGSLNADPSTCRSASRTSIEPDLRLNTVGFRLVMDV